MPAAKAEGLSLTPSAVSHVLRYARKSDRPPAIRIGVRTSSCSAHAYTFDLTDKVGDGDRVFDCDGVRVAIDPKSLVFLEGTRIDYRKEGLQEGFAFENPNVKGTCGCGESFTV